MINEEHKWKHQVMQAYFGVGIFDFIGLYIFEYTFVLSFGENTLLSRDGEVERLAAKLKKNWQL